MPPTPRRALILGYPSTEPIYGAGLDRAVDFAELLTEEGWSVSFAVATALGDSPQARELRQAGMPVHDGSAADFEGRLRDDSYRIAICTSWQIAELYLPMLRRAAPQTAVIVDAPGIQSVRDAQRIFAGVHSFGAAASLGPEYGAEVAGELNVYAAADVVLAGCDSDASLVNTLIGAGHAISVPDLAPLSAGNTPAGARRGIAVASALPDPDCVEAADCLRSEILPLIDPSRIAGHPLLVMGEGDISQPFGPETAFTMLGARPEYASVLARARLAVMPLRRNVNRRLLVQSVSSGTPVVATSASLSGLHLDAGRHVLVGDRPAAMAAAIASVLGDESLWRRLSRAGRAQMDLRHGRAPVKAQLLSALDVACRRRPSERPRPADGGREAFMVRVVRERNRAIVPAIRRMVGSLVSEADRVLVLSGGADELLRIGGGPISHFPGYGGDPPTLIRPSDSDEAVALLEQEIRAGARLLVIPRTATDWLRAYPGFEDYLRDRFTHRESDACTLIPLHGDDSHHLPARLIAFYLPQFHPIPENDDAWGGGFTEWSNVGRARALFEDHYQPHVPGELGFYDLRLAATREAQARLAAEAGIHAFCYYHYWFKGKRLLNRPFDEVLASGEPDFPFCLCWANEPWSRHWDGRDDQVLQAQAYSLDDDRDHIRWLIPALADPRAVTVDGKPLFLVYHARDLPDVARTADLWRHEVRMAGLPGLHLMAVETDRDANWDATQHGFDAKVRFQPDFSVLHSLPQVAVDGASELRVWDYDRAIRGLAAVEPVSYRRYETVCPGWDNSPRVGERGLVLHNSTARAYGRWLQEVIERAQRYPADQRLVFVNAWNEWAEGAHLEPDRQAGRAYLDATRAAMRRASGVKRQAVRTTAEGTAHVLSPSSDGGPATAAPLATRGPRARAVAFYLPQFHPTPENDAFWGPGFTEWTSVITAKPLYEGHHQPQVPSHLGFYDLRVPEVREAQADLARTHGIEAFCYWHYWFGGRRLLHRPLDEMISSGRPDFPFCLAWANEPWSRAWLGDQTEILVDTEYSAQDDLAHARWLVSVFADARYWTVLDRPVFLVYRPRQLGNARRMTDILRQECARAGLPNPLLLGTTAWGGLDPGPLGFDGAVEFEPRFGALGDPSTPQLKVYDYTEARALMKSIREFPVYPSVVVGWDNTPRRGSGGSILEGATPQAFEAALRGAIAAVADRPLSDRLVFINAWNEWGEGNRLEPEERYGLAYLEAVRRAILE